MLYRDALGLLAYWGDFPPAHILVRYALGYKPRPASSPTRSDLEALAAQFGRAG